jgi:integrase
MTTLPTQPARRAKGSGTKPTWDAQRQRWVCRVTLADGSRRSIRTRTEKECEKERARLLEAVDSGSPTPASKLTVAAFLDDWIASVEVASRSGKPKRRTYVSYEMHCRVHLKPGLGSLPLAKLSVSAVQKWADAKLAAGHSPASMSRVRATLRIALGRALRQKLVTSNVAKLVELSVPDNSRVGRALDPAQVASLLAAAETERHGPMLAFLVCTGLRLGEALALRWSDVDERKGRVVVRHTLERLPNQPWRLTPPKSRPSKDRRVPLVPTARMVLTRQKDRQRFESDRAGSAWLGDEFVFANEQGGPSAARGVQDAFKRSLGRADLPLDLRVHDLRHSACTYLIAAGVPLTTVQSILGHSTLVMTQRYAHTADTMLEDAGERLAAFFGAMPINSAVSG